MSVEEKLSKKHQLEDEEVDKKEKKKLKKEKKEKKDKKDKKEKKDKKDKKEKKEKKEKEDKESIPETKHEESTDTTDEPAIEQATQAQADEFFKTNSISIEDPDKSSLKPFLEFSHVHLDPKLIKVLSKFPRPTPIQSASWPYLFSGRDVVGVAETGSGKTFAFAVPALSHLLKNNPKKKGVRVLVVSPTRELAMQIYDSVTELTSAVGLKATCVYGGVPKDPQRKAVAHSNIVVATPGRLKDLLEEGSADITNVDFLILDEADRMLEKGFEEDIKTIINATQSTPEKRQTLMFTATWPPQVRELAAGYMKKNTVKVNIGEADELAANKRITQIVEVIDPQRKEQRLLQLLREYQSGPKKNDKILVFALYKKEASRVERFLQNKGYNVAAIHGDLSQQQRTHALEEFKSGRSKIMLATDVAARGLDIPAVKVVINLTFPLTAEDYVHRIGRTGRAGQTGTAVTLFTEHEKHLSGALINVLRGANQPVPDELLKFGSHTKKKEHSVYGAFYKDIDPTQKAKKIKFD
ncbi:uncharacterized protein SAPINGB_P000254 [Magnusiomyces paraingens]|uniref:ATP-dependent RNA helicase DBP3 n=1 Tax=Magnusiomyces paraingens TaxID=2606893 RepID=A0A5E8AZ68_9ASCO|nr:uncharacterized protein SAPINGB_P000254 [Saprochaete ingens]VVT44004.1 unnamed protein product [Saprochaete ingens]